MKWGTDVLSYSLVQCPSDTCNGEYAYFYQLQIRSADEPMTTFLRVSFGSFDVMFSVLTCMLTPLQCTTCAKTWRD